MANNIRIIARTGIIDVCKWYYTVYNTSNSISLTLLCVALFSDGRRIFAANCHPQLWSEGASFLFDNATGGTARHAIRINPSVPKQDTTHPERLDWVNTRGGQRTDGQVAATAAANNPSRSNSIDENIPWVFDTGMLTEFSVVLQKLHASDGSGRGSDRKIPAAIGWTTVPLTGMASIAHETKYTNVSKVIKNSACLLPGILQKTRIIQNTVSSSHDACIHYAISNRNEVSKRGCQSIVRRKSIQTRIIDR